MSEGRDNRTLFLTSAVEAAAALARLLGCDEPKEALYCEPLALDELRARLFVEGRECVAVFADLNGGLMGQAGVAFTAAATAAVVERLVGDPQERALEGPSASALCEVGNIAISAAAGVLGQCHGPAVVPSVPRLGTDLASALSLDSISEEIGRLPALLVEAELGEPDDAVPIALVWIPGE